MSTFKEFADFMSDGAIHCGESDFDEGCTVTNEELFSYDDLVHLVATMFSSALQRGLTDAELEDFHTACNNFSVSPLDVLSIEGDEL